MSQKEDNLEYEVLSEAFNDYDLSYKIILIGDSGVGKSCLTMRGTKNNFEEYYSPTVGFDFFVFNIRVNDKNIKLQIWDTCGQEAYKSLISSFYRNATLAIVAYAINNEQSFKNIEAWLNEIKTQANPETKIFLIGTKIDLNEERRIPTEMAKNFSKEHGFNYFIETSAKTGVNAQEVFIQAAKQLYLYHFEYKDRASRISSIITTPYQELNNNNLLGDDDEDNRPRKKKGCC
jgi:small GTP-binding protein